MSPRWADRPPDDDPEDVLLPDPRDLHHLGGWVTPTGTRVDVYRHPDAGNPYVRFDAQLVRVTPSLRRLGVTAALDELGGLPADVPPSWAPGVAREVAEAAAHPACVPECDPAPGDLADAVARADREAPDPDRPRYRALATPDDATPSPTTLGYDLVVTRVDAAWRAAAGDRAHEPVLELWVVARADGTLDPHHARRAVADVVRARSHPRPTRVSPADVEVYLRVTDDPPPRLEEVT